MHAHHFVGARSEGRQAGNRDGGSIRRQDGVARAKLVELAEDPERTMRLYDIAEAVDALLEGNQPVPAYLLSTRITVEALRDSFADPSAIDVRRFREQVDWYAELLDDPTTSEGTPRDDWE